MYQITKGYKKGRGVSFYDLSDDSGVLFAEKVEKEKIVDLCSNGKILNAKIQWWEGKPIVRLQGSNIPLVKLDTDGNVAGEAKRIVRNTSAQVNNAPEQKEVIKDMTSNSQVIGKLNNKKAFKKNTAYAGYDSRNLAEQSGVKQGINFMVFKTVGDMVDAMMTEFKVNNKNEYKKEISKKVKMDKELSSMNTAIINSLASSIATYLMNMAMEELNNTYLKYFVR